MKSSIGDIAALGKLLDEHRSRLVAMVCRRMDSRLAQRLDAKQIVSEEFVEARSKYEDYKSKTDKPIPAERNKAKVSGSRAEGVNGSPYSIRYP